MYRNKEIRQFTILFLVITAAATTAGFVIDPAAGVLLLISAAAFGAAFFIFTKNRYDKIAAISEQIDQVLHNADYLCFDESNEGELSILQSEIAKMTLRIREQNDALKREKEHLADSLADIAHQLRTPLTSINLILSLLRNESDESKRRSMLREAEELLLQMDWLINTLLKLSRLDAGIVVFENEPVEVSSLISKTLRPLRISMELRSITLQVAVPDGMTIQGDQGWLAEALQNILKNCMQSIDHDGNIEITGEDNLLFGEIIIRDHGAGFSKEVLSHLFERFYRGDNNSAAGYGIGMALCRMIITRQGGTVTAGNHPQGGAVFAIRFPK